MLKVAQALEEDRIPYMLVGSFSSNYYGIPRSTEDVDFVVEFNEPLNEKFSNMLGNAFKQEPQLSFETNTGTQRQEFFVEGTAFKVELFRLSDDSFDQSRFKRKQKVQIAGQKVYFPTAEDVIVMKLRWARIKDIEDVRDVIAVQQDKLDWKYIEGWCHIHGSLPVLQTIRQTVTKN